MMNFLIQITWLPILGPLYLAQQIDCTSYDLSSKGFKPCTLAEVDYQDSYLYWTVYLSTSVENEQLLFWQVECFLSMQNCDNLVHVCFWQLNLQGELWSGDRSCWPDYWLQRSQQSSGMVLPEGVSLSWFLKLQQPGNQYVRVGSLSLDWNP